MANQFIFILLILSDVTEVSFQLETHLSSVTSEDGLTARDYITIGLCSLILGLIYVASVFLYLHVKKYKSRNSSSGHSVSNTVAKSDFPSNDQVTFGSGFSHNYNRTSQSIRGPDRTSGSSRGSLPLNGLAGDEMGIIKSNPLLKHYPNLNDNAGFVSDVSHSNSECDDERAMSHDMMKNVRITHTRWENWGIFVVMEFVGISAGSRLRSRAPWIDPNESSRINWQGECIESIAGGGMSARGECVDYRGHDHRREDRKYEGDCEWDNAPEAVFQSSVF